MSKTNIEKRQISVAVNLSIFAFKNPVFKILITSKLKQEVVHVISHSLTKYYLIPLQLLSVILR